MEIIKTVIWVVEIVSALSIIVLVLLQHGKGADAGATFGSSGGSGSLFGASGSSNFLSKTTAIFATVFFVSTFALVMLFSRGRVGDVGVMAHVSNKVNASKIVASIPKAIKVSASSGVGVKLPTTTKNQENQIPQ